MDRRQFLVASAGALAGSRAAPVVAQARGRTLRFVPAAALTALDPVWTTAAVTRVHGYLVFDSLYGTDGNLEPRPQMAEGASFDDDGLACVVTLRSGLRFHDGESVRAIDCVASLKRWMKRSPMGQKLESVTTELTALDDRRLRFRLTKRFPQLLHALAAVGPQALIMPERLANTSPFEQVREVVGSGPYRFKADEYMSGNRAVYERFDGYVPTPDRGTGLTAGPKVANFDRVEWHMIPDPATAAAALQSGEVDWFEQPPPELAQLLRRNRNLVVIRSDRFPQVAGLRFNHLNAPFDVKAVRQAILPAVNQTDYAMSVVGDDPDLREEIVGVFTPGGSSASMAGLGALQGPRSIERARQMVRAAGYADQPVRQLAPTDLASVTAVSQVAADMLRRIGFNLDLQLSDWGTVVQRRASREPLDRGGWSVFCTTFSWFEYVDPAVNVALRGNGTSAYFGWPTMPKLEELREAWFDATDVASRHGIAEQMQAVALDELPFVPLGGFHLVTAHRRDLVDRVQALPLFWSIRRG